MNYFMCNQKYLLILDSSHLMSGIEGQDIFGWVLAYVIQTKVPKSLKVFIIGWSYCSFNFYYLFLKIILLKHIVNH